MLIIAGMAAVTLTGCQQQDEVTETPATEPSYVLADLALSLPASSGGTRLDQSVTTGGDATHFRGISKLSIIPFTKRGKITKSDQPSIIEISNSISNYTPIHESNNDELYRYYEKVFLNHGVASFLTYGRGDKTNPANTSGLTDKVFYGSLIPKVAGVEMTYIPDRLSVTAGDLSFELETIYNVTDGTTGQLKVPDEAKAIADYLTYIANTKETVGDTEYSWKSNSNQINETLKGLYSSFISSQGAGKYGVLAGSAANVKAYVNELYQKLQNLINTDQNFGEGSISRTIAEAIQSRIVDTGFSSDYTGFSVNVTGNKVTSFGSATYDEYPSNKNLPDGAAVLQWGKITDTTYGFIPQVQTTNTANVSSMNRYTYPAELYYYGNSLIKTSNDEVPVTSYSGKATWKDVVDDLYMSGSVVTNNTKALAIVDPMQYAVARLQGTVQAVTEVTDKTLYDADSQPVSLKNGDDNSFPITGLIVSGQYPVNFDFTPKLDGASEDNEHFVYDSYLGSDPLYLTTSQTSPFYTMVMQTHDYEDVTVILELVNNSGTDFKGENGIVYRGTKFYLAGKVELSNGTPDSNLSESEQADVSNRVFTQDHTTVVSMKVSSLAKAYNVMPNIQSGRLEVGVEINLKWEQATPKTIVFEE